MDTKEKNEHKFTKRFIGCIIYLSIAGLLAFCYFLGAISLNIEKSNGAAILDLFDIVFICILMLPPIIWMICLIKNKKVWKSTNDKMFNTNNLIEKQNQNIKEEKLSPDLKNTNENSIRINTKNENIEDKKLRIERELHENSIYIIDKIIEKFLNEEKLTTIINNYIKTHSLSLFALEFCSLPLFKHPNFEDHIKVQDKVELTTEFFFALQFYNCESQYFNFVKNFNHNILDSNEKNVRIAYDMRNYYYDKWEGPIVNEFKGYQNLFQMLRNQKILEIDTNEKLHYYAFLYLVYLKGKHYFSNLAEERLKDLDIEINSDESNIVGKLYENDIQENIIVDTIWCINSKKCNYTDLINIEYSIIQNRIKQIINDIKEKEQIQKLLNTDNQKVRYSLVDIDLMSGSQFEYFVTYIFNQLGYKAETTKLSGDQGIDVIATKGKTKIAIQAKCYSQPVGNHAIMEAVAGAKYYQADKVMVVTNNYFTKSAKELAKSNNVILWDRSILKEKLEQI